MTLNPNGGNGESPNGFLSGGASTTASGIPNVQGAQYASPGANGVTSYGLFSNAGKKGVLPPKPTAPPTMGINPPPTMLPPGAMPNAPTIAKPPILRGGTPQLPQLPSGINPAMPTIGNPQIPTIAPPSAMLPQGQLTGMRSTGRQALAGRGAPAGGGLGAPTMQMSQGGSGGTMTLPPPPSGGGTQMQAQTAGGDATQDMFNTFIAAHPEIAQLFGLVPGSGQAAEDAAGAAGDAAGNLAGDAGGFAGATVGQGMGDFIKAFNDATGNGGGGNFFDYLKGAIPGFEQNGLMGAVGQNMTSAMDPAAWQQMASNREAQLDESNLAGLNLQERRMADMAGRTGFANTGGATSQMYNDFNQRGIQGRRDIFNDILPQQMNAMNMAGQFALGQNGQDQQRWSQLLGLGGQGAMANFMANREDNPSGGAVLQDLMGAIGGMAQGGGGILQGLLPLLLMGGGAAAAI